jgi:deferrochelatase/peroxidase EfeB
MTDKKTNAETPENPTKAELEKSLEQAEFPAASHMSKMMFGEQKSTDDTDNKPKD